jgi:hypothetical protein
MEEFLLEIKLTPGRYSKFILEEKKKLSKAAMGLI